MHTAVGTGEVRRVDRATDLISTVAGGHRGRDGDGGLPERAGMARPHGCWLGADARPHTADSEPHRVSTVDRPAPIATGRPQS